MKKCKYCRSEIDAKAKICPNCKKRIKTSPFVWTITVLFVIVVAVSISSGGNSETTGTEKFSIVEGSEKGYADDYQFAYYIEGTVKNNTNKDYSYLQVTYNVYDKDGNNLGTCLANNNNVEANSTWKFKAVCSGEAKDIATYKLDEITGW